MKILLLAGEQSGIFYTERIKDALRRLYAQMGTDPATPVGTDPITFPVGTDPITFRGYGDYGFKTTDLAVMGILPVLTHIFYFLRVARTMKKVIDTWKPDAVVTVDYPGLNLKLAAYAKARGIPAIHVVCPQVWAWHRSRIPKIAQHLTLLLCFFPFEPSLFRNYIGRFGFQATFIGHPLVDVFAEEDRVGTDPVRVGTDPVLPDCVGTDPALPDCVGTDPVLPNRYVALLPGSRQGEIARILPRMVAAARLMRKRVGETVPLVIPAAHPTARRQIERILSEHPLTEVTILDGQARNVLRHAAAAAVASGTATLEAALARVPTVLVYATTPSFAFFLRYFVTGVRFAGLVNIIDERCRYNGDDPPPRRPGEGPGHGGPMPELLQEEFTPEALADLLTSYWSDADARTTALSRLDRATALIRSNGRALENAAREILRQLKKDA